MILNTRTPGEVAVAEQIKTTIRIAKSLAWDASEINAVTFRSDALDAAIDTAHDALRDVEKLLEDDE